MNTRNLPEHRKALVEHWQNGLKAYEESFYALENLQKEKKEFDNLKAQIDAEEDSFVFWLIKCNAYILWYINSCFEAFATYIIDGFISIITDIKEIFDVIKKNADLADDAWTGLREPLHLKKLLGESTYTKVGVYLTSIIGIILFLYEGGVETKDAIKEITNIIRYNIAEAEFKIAEKKYQEAITKYNEKLISKDDFDITESDYNAKKELFESLTVPDTINAFTHLPLTIFNLIIYGGGLAVTIALLAGVIAMPIAGSVITACLVIPTLNRLVKNSFAYQETIEAEEEAEAAYKESLMQHHDYIKLLEAKKEEFDYLNNLLNEIKKKKEDAHKLLTTFPDSIEEKIKNNYLLTKKEKYIYQEYLFQTDSDRYLQSQTHTTFEVPATEAALIERLKNLSSEIQINEPQDLKITRLKYQSCHEAKLAAERTVAFRTLEGVAGIVSLVGVVLVSAFAITTLWPVMVGAVVFGVTLMMIDYIDKKYDNKLTLGIRDFFTPKIVPMATSIPENTAVAATVTPEIEPVIANTTITVSKITPIAIAATQVEPEPEKIPIPPSRPIDIPRIKPLNVYGNLLPTFFSPTGEMAGGCKLRSSSGTQLPTKPTVHQ